MCYLVLVVAAALKGRNCKGREILLPYLQLHFQEQLQQVPNKQEQAEETSLHEVAGAFEGIEARPALSAQNPLK
jgi:hypothetical protein